MASPVQMLKGVVSSISNHLCLIYLYPWVLFHLTGGLPSLLLCSKLVIQNWPQTIGQFPYYAKLLETIVHLDSDPRAPPRSSTQEAILSATNDWYLTLTSKQELFVCFLIFPRCLTLFLIATFFQWACSPNCQISPHLVCWQYPIVQWSSVWY